MHAFEHCSHKKGRSGGSKCPPALCAASLDALILAASGPEFAATLDVALALCRHMIVGGRGWFLLAGNALYASLRIEIGLADGTFCHSRGLLGPPHGKILYAATLSTTTVHSNLFAVYFPLMQHLIETQQFDREALNRLFALATSLEGKRDESLKGRIMASLFYEPSTRTRLSFESAMLRLGGGVITMESSESSSQSKGETLEDSIKVISQYADIIVMRHGEVGAAAQAAAVSQIPIVNAGDGNMGQHPTQALLDLYTIQRELGREDNYHVAVVGNLKYYRSPRSLAYLLSKYKGIRVTFISSPELRMQDDVKEHLKEHGIAFIETEDLAGGIREADVVYQTRIAKEWINNDTEYEKQRGRYIITRAVADAMKKDAIIIHPLPRIGEIEAEVDSSPHAVYFKQVGYGLNVRMALLKTLLSD